MAGWAADGRRRVNSLMPRLRDLAGAMLGQLRSASVVAAVQNGVQCTASFPNPRFFAKIGVSGSQFLPSDPLFRSLDAFTPGKT